MIKFHDQKSLSNVRITIHDHKFTNSDALSPKLIPCAFITQVHSLTNWFLFHSIGLLGPDPYGPCPATGWALVQVLALAAPSEAAAWAGFQAHLECNFKNHMVILIMKLIMILIINLMINCKQIIYWP